MALSRDPYVPCFAWTTSMDSFMERFSVRFLAMVSCVHSFAGFSFLILFRRAFPQLFPWVLCRENIPWTPLRGLFSCPFSQGFYCMHFRRDFE